MHSLHRPRVGGWATFGLFVAATPTRGRWSLDTDALSLNPRHSIWWQNLACIKNLQIPSNRIHIVWSNSSCVITGHPQVQHSMPECNVVHVRQCHFGRRNFITYFQREMDMIRQQRQTRNPMLFLCSGRQNSIAGLLEECRFRSAPSRCMDKYNVQSQDVLPVTAVLRFSQNDIFKCQREALQQLLAAMARQRMMFQLLSDVVRNDFRARFAYGCQTKIASKGDGRKRPQHRLQSSFDRFDNCRRGNRRLSAQEKLDRSVWERVMLQNSDVVTYRDGFQIIKPLVGRWQRQGGKQRQRPTQLIRCAAVFDCVKWGRRHSGAMLSQRMRLGHFQLQPAGVLRLHRPQRLRLKLSIRPCVGGSVTDKLRHPFEFCPGLHRPRVGVAAKSSQKSPLHRRGVGGEPARTEAQLTITNMWNELNQTPKPRRGRQPGTSKP